MPAAVSLRAALAPLIALVLACPGIAAGQDLGVCAPLEGTGSYSQCINEQLTRQRKDLREDAPGRSPRPVQRPDFVITDPDLRVPDYRDTMTERTERDMEAARRNSDLRTRQLQQQIRKEAAPRWTS